ncbi:hypothetical protein SAMD00019534_117160 [Acytostelium subglobosum LB1]|uniref:hypothetical protein n=1 Tax=Acytostelium subglobosum LB1 TaxID=1410327 RepID=UPI0006451C23|nr:hypothetical protein SAMD00019534_117160 [Acytostelium subglobosum LB1]GAM28540.1 hypothetical protein SAMD00019534_117160 [Acytostelium subglobosum LB1]|eukprot:XP_012748579.1 hypothetical protein SAMD00019534_117160 [Acytostelium subglobosum LB1]
MLGNNHFGILKEKLKLRLQQPLAPNLYYHSSTITRFTLVTDTELFDLIYDDCPSMFVIVNMLEWSSTTNASLFRHVLHRFRLAYDCGNDYSLLTSKVIEMNDPQLLRAILEDRPQAKFKGGNSTSTTIRSPEIFKVLKEFDRHDIMHHYLSTNTLGRLFETNSVEIYQYYTSHHPLDVNGTSRSWSSSLEQLLSEPQKMTRDRADLVEYFIIQQYPGLDSLAKINEQVDHVCEGLPSEINAYIRLYQYARYNRSSLNKDLGAYSVMLNNGLSQVISIANYFNGHHGLIKFLMDIGYLNQVLTEGSLESVKTAWSIDPTPVAIIGNIYHVELEVAKFILEHHSMEDNEWKLSSVKDPIDPDTVMYLYDQGLIPRTKYHMGHFAYCLAKNGHFRQAHKLAPHLKLTFLPPDFIAFIQHPLPEMEVLTLVHSINPKFDSLNFYLTANVDLEGFDHFLSIIGSHLAKSYIQAFEYHNTHQYRILDHIANKYAQHMSFSLKEKYFLGLYYLGHHDKMMQFAKTWLLDPAVDSLLWGLVGEIGQYKYFEQAIQYHQDAAKATLDQEWAASSALRQAVKFSRMDFVKQVLQTYKMDTKPDWKEVNMRLCLSLDQLSMFQYILSLPDAVKKDNTYSKLFQTALDLGAGRCAKYLLENHSIVKLPVVTQQNMLTAIPLIDMMIAKGVYSLQLLPESGPIKLNYQSWKSIQTMITK